MNITEEDIKSYIEQFKVDRVTAIKEIKETLNNYYKEEKLKIEETYQDIIRDSY